MRRFSLVLATAAAAVALSALPTAADYRGAHAPAHPRAAYHPNTRIVPVQASPRVNVPSSTLLYRDPVYANGLVHPGFYGGFDRFGGVLPRSALYGFGASRGGDTNVDVDVRAGSGGSRTPPIVLAPPSSTDGGAALDALRRENWELRRALEPNLDYLGIAATAQGEGAAELRELVGAIIARRDRQRQERISGARVVAVDEFQRELGSARGEIRKLENRPRNKHILYLGFDE